MTSRRAYPVALAMLLAAVALVLLPASGLAQSTAQTRVGASAVLATARAGEFSPLAAVSQLGKAHAYDENASGSLLAAEGGVSLEASAAARATELQGMLPAGSAGRVTMGFGYARDGEGGLVRLVGTSEPGGYLRPGVT